MTICRKPVCWQLCAMQYLAEKTDQGSGEKICAGVRSAKTAVHERCRNVHGMCSRLWCACLPVTNIMWASSAHMRNVSDALSRVGASVRRPYRGGNGMTPYGVETI